MEIRNEITDRKMTICCKMFKNQKMESYIRIRNPVGC